MVGRDRDGHRWLVGIGMVIGGGLVGVWWAFTFIPHQGVKGNLAKLAFPAWNNNYLVKDYFKHICISGT